MTRLLYRCLVHLHPRWFRRRFGDEMLAVFDEAPGKPVLLADAAVSVLRQWAFRSEVGETAAVADPSGAPLFYTFDNSRPRRAALIQGTLMSLAVFSAIAFAINRGGPRHLRPLPLPWYSSSWTGWRPGAPAQEVETKSESLWSLLTSSAKSQAPPALEVVGLLDDDGDGVLSGSEIEGAAAALHQLDRNQDRTLAPLELLPFPAAVPAPGAAASETRPRPPAARPLPQRATLAEPSGVPVREFVRIDLVVAVLDTDRDGTLSEQEMERAPAVLKRLDKNGDGRLTRNELLAAVRR